MAISGNWAASGDGTSSERNDAFGPLMTVDLRLQQIHEAAHEFGVFTLDRSGRVVTWNALAEQVSGYTADQVLGRNFSCFYPDTEAADGQPA